MLSHLRVVDLAGLCDRKIGRMYHTRLKPADFSRYVFHDVDADFMKLDDDMWKQRVGLLGNEQLAKDYIDLGHGEFVRRASIRADLDESAVRAIAAKISFAPSLSSLHQQMIAAPPFGSLRIVRSKKICAGDVDFRKHRQSFRYQAGEADSSQSLTRRTPPMTIHFNTPPVLARPCRRAGCCNYGPA